MTVIDWYTCFDPKTVSFKPFRFVTKMYISGYMISYHVTEISVLFHIFVYMYVYIYIYLFI